MQAASRLMACHSAFERALSRAHRRRCMGTCPKINLALWRGVLEERAIPCDLGPPEVGLLDLSGAPSGRLMAACAIADGLISPPDMGVAESPIITAVMALGAPHLQNPNRAQTCPSQLPGVPAPSRSP